MPLFASAMATAFARTLERLHYITTDTILCRMGDTPARKHAFTEPDTL
jgi:hypothetical protein